jgi:hypothetical protein
MRLIRRGKLRKVKVVAHLGSRNQPLKCQAISDAPAFPVNEEKRLILSDWPAQSNAELILLEDGLWSVGGKIIAGIQFVVSEVLVYIPVERVCAGLDGHVDHAARAAPVLHVVIAGLQLEL